jgi:hypothetical protein
MPRTLKRAALAAMVAGGLIGGLAGSATPIAAGGVSERLNGSPADRRP